MVGDQIGKMYPGVAAGMILLNEKGELFLMRRTPKTRNDHGKWSIPGGKVELNEKVEDAVVRETLEEADVSVEELEYLGYVDHILEGESQHWVAQIFLAKKWEGEPKNLEPGNFSEVAWIALDAIPEDSSQVVKGAVKLLKR